MYWAGGCPSHVSRSGKPYAGATRWLEPKGLDVKIPQPPIDWTAVICAGVAGVGFFATVIALCIVMALTL